MPTYPLDRLAWLKRIGMLVMDKPDDDAGGQDTDSDTTDDQDADDAAEGDDAGNEEPTLESVQAQLEAQRRINRNLERRTKADQKKIAGLEAASAQAPTADVPDADQLREQIRTEMRIENAHTLAQARAEAALAGKVSIDPKRAVLLMGDSLKDAVGDDGSLDEQAITDAVADLLEQNPGLKVAAQGGPQFLGTADGGARKADDRSEEQQLRDAIAAAEKAGDFRRSIPLKQQLAAVLANKTKKG